MDAIDHMVQMIGIDHVGFGADYTQDQPESFWRYIGSQQGTKFPASFTPPDANYHDMALYPKGLETTDKLPALADALDRRGYEAPDMEKVLGGKLDAPVRGSVGLGRIS